MVMLSPRLLSCVLPVEIFLRRLHAGDIFG
jgi:hypothetical protein